jgi:hypothetical protein
MIRYNFVRALRTPRSVFFLAGFVLLLGAAALSSLLAQTPQHAEMSSQAMALSASTTRNSDVFLRLAETVGQTAPAKRLIEYTLRNDATGGGRYWAIVDFDQPSTSKRFYLFDTLTKRVDTFYVAHGRGSEGRADDGIADVFSNQPHSNSSSLGIYRALDEYAGNHGRSMRLQGLEATNSNALSRAVVLHKASYVSENFIRSTGRLGRSEGCFAVEPSVEDALVDKLKNGAYIIAWKTPAQNQ